MYLMCVQRVSARSPLTLHPKAELILNTHIIVADIHQDMSKAHEGTGGQDQAVRDLNYTLFTTFRLTPSAT